MNMDRMLDASSDTIVTFPEYVSALFVGDRQMAVSLCRLLKASGIPARMDAEIADCVGILVPDEHLEVATEILAKRKKDVEEEEDLDDEEEEEDEEDVEDDDEEDEDFEEEDFEEEFEDEELDEDEDDIFYDDDDEE